MFLGHFHEITTEIEEYDSQTGENLLGTQSCDQGENGEWQLMSQLEKFGAWLEAQEEVMRR